MATQRRLWLPSCAGAGVKKKRVPAEHGATHSLAADEATPAGKPVLPRLVYVYEHSGAFLAVYPPGAGGQGPDPPAPDLARSVGRRPRAAPGPAPGREPTR